MLITREDAEHALRAVHAALDSQHPPPLAYGICCMLHALGPVDGCVYGIVGTLFNEEIPYYRDPKCPPEWQRGVWSEERMTLLCMLGALSADDIVEMCQ